VSKPPRTAPTLSTRDVGGVRRLATHSARKPDCTKCGHHDHVVRMWHGRIKMWVCTKHYPITSTKAKEATMMQRLFHKLPEPETVELTDILPNRKARRRRG